MFQCAFVIVWFFRCCDGSKLCRNFSITSIQVWNFTSLKNHSKQNLIGPDRPTKIRKPAIIIPLIDVFIFRIVSYKILDNALKFVA